MNQIKFILSAIVSAFLLSNCATVAAGAVGAAAGATAAVTTDPRTSGTVVDDNTIETKLQFKYNSKYPTSNIYVNDYNGTILLTGQAVDQKTKDSAEFDAKAMPGVRRIYNYITIRLPQSIASRSTDSYTTTQVRTKILGLNGVKSANIKVITTNSVVYLFGIVNKAEAQKVADAAASVSGVEKVVTLFEYVNG